MWCNIIHLYRLQVSLNSESPRFITKSNIQLQRSIASLLDFTVTHILPFTPSNSKFADIMSVQIFCLNTWHQPSPALLPGVMHSLMSCNIKIEVSCVFHLISMSRDFNPVSYWEAVNSIYYVALVVNTTAIVMGPITYNRRKDSCRLCIWKTFRKICRRCELSI